MKIFISIQSILLPLGLLFLTACSDTPNISPSAFAQSVVINEDERAELNLSGIDKDGSITTYTVTTGPVNGSLTGSGANLIYTPNLNFNGSDTFQFSVTDNEGAISTPVSVNITIIPVNDSPVSALDDSYNVLENQTATGVLLNLLATDPEDDEITVSLDEGHDNALFTLDTTSSELLFNTAPDFENPLDANNDNNYQVAVLYTDSNNNQSTALANINVTDESKIELVMIFPTPNANLGGDLTEITLRGSFVDTEDNNVLSTDVSTATVNGIQTTLTNDNTSWLVTIPVYEQTNDLIFDAVSSSGALSTSSQLLFNTTQPVNTGRVIAGVFDKVGNRLLLIDDQLDAVLSMDLTSNIVTVLSDSGRGTGENFESPQRLTFDSVNNRVFVSDSSLDAIFEVDGITGNRTIIVDTYADSQVPLFRPTGLTYDATNNQIYVVVTNSDILKVDIVTGDRTVVSGLRVGSGEYISRLSEIVLDLPNDRLYVLDYSRDIIFGVNLTSGYRTVIASADIGTGAEVNELAGLAFNSDKTALFVTSALDETSAPDEEVLIEVDLTTLNRIIVSDIDTGEGPNFEQLQGIISSDDNNKVWVLDTLIEGVVSIDLANGNRELLSVSENQQSTFIAPTGLAIDSASNRLLVIDENALYAVDTSSTQTGGELSILSNDETGAGLALNSAKKLTFDEENNQVFTVTNDESNIETIIAIDLNTGNRSVVSPFFLYENANILDIEYDPINNEFYYIELFTSEGLRYIFSLDPVANTFAYVSDFAMYVENPEREGWFDEVAYYVTGLTVDAEQNRLFATAFRDGVLLSADLLSDDFIVISSDDIGAGPVLDRPFSLTFGETNESVFVVDVGLNQVFSVDLISGDRTLISDVSPGVNLLTVVDIKFDREKKLLFLADSMHQHIYVIDAETGERAYVTHAFEYETD